jgi:hypothetical protein
LPEIALDYAEAIAFDDSQHGVAVGEIMDLVDSGPGTYADTRDAVYLTFGAEARQVDDLH